MAPTAPKQSLIEHFSALADPRQAWKVVYPLPEIRLLVLGATLAGADDFVETAAPGARSTSASCAVSCPMPMAFPATTR